MDLYTARRHVRIPVQDQEDQIPKENKETVEEKKSENENQKSEDDKSTPGFEIFIILFSLLTIILLKKKKFF